MSFFSNATQFGLPGLMGLGQRNQNPANAAMPYLNQIPGMAQQNLSPYIQQGFQGDQQAQNAYGNIGSLYGNAEDYYQPNNEVSQGYRGMSQNPLEYVNQIMRGYQPSEGYKYKENRMLNGARNSAASGGFAGTHNDQEYQADMIRGLLGQDMQQHYGNVMGAQNQGLQGLERMMEGRQRGQGMRLGGQERGLAHLGQMGENQGNRGFNAATDLSSILGSNMGQQAGMAFQGGRQRNQNRNDRMQLMAQLAGMFM